MGNLASMRAAVAALESTLKASKPRILIRAEQVAAELEAQRQWRIASAKRHVRPQGEPKK